MRSVAACPVTASGRDASMSPPIHVLHSVNRLSSYKSKTNEAESARVESTHKAVPLVEFMYLVFTCMPGESYSR